MKFEDAIKAIWNKGEISNPSFKHKGTLFFKNDVLWSSNDDKPAFIGKNTFRNDWFIVNNVPKEIELNGVRYVLKK